MRFILLIAIVASLCVKSVCLFSSRYFSEEVQKDLRQNEEEIAMSVESFKSKKVEKNDPREE